MSPRAWFEFATLIALSLAVAILGPAELGPAALIIAGAGTATAVFGAIRDHDQP